MINIRKGIYETNSSSTHSICISKKNNYEIPDKLIFTLGDFGWEEEFLYDSSELGSYLYSAIVCLYDKQEMNDYKNYIFDTLSKYDCECEFEEPKTNTYGYIDCSVDHVGELSDILSAIRKSEKKLLRFLFSPDSFIITGNDNSDWFYETRKKTDFSKVDEFRKGN